MFILENHNDIDYVVKKNIYISIIIISEPNGREQSIV